MDKGTVTVVFLPLFIIALAVYVISSNWTKNLTGFESAPSRSIKSALITYFSSYFDGSSYASVAEDICAVTSPSQKKERGLTGCVTSIERFPCVEAAL